MAAMTQPLYDQCLTPGVRTLTDTDTAPFPSDVLREGSRDTLFVVPAASLFSSPFVALITITKSLPRYTFAVRSSASDACFPWASFRFFSESTYVRSRRHERYLLLVCRVGQKHRLGFKRNENRIIMVTRLYGVHQTDLHRCARNKVDAGL